LLEDIRVSDDIFKPKSYEDYVGQPAAKRFVQVMTEAANKDQRLFPSMLISGTAGLGKTTLAQIVLRNVPYRFIDGSAVNTEYPNLRNYVLIDEIHNIKPDVCDTLNIMMDNTDIVIFGCTTNPGMLNGPFRSRFRSVNLTPYSVDDLIEIMKKVLIRRGHFTISDEQLRNIASRGRRTPRITLQYLSFVMDLMLVHNLTVLDDATLDEAFSMIGVDERGLLPIDYRYLEAFPTDGRPVGLQYLSAVTYTDKETLEQEVEPYLLSLKIIDRTPKGRILLEPRPAYA
jgi:Holliday junction DNA helicase RuvB